MKYKKFKNPRLIRLAEEHKLLDEFCQQSDLVDYRVPRLRRDMPPSVYILTYNVISIIGIDESQQPIYGDKHECQISLPEGYPITDAPICRMLTPIWHPNIRHAGKFQGRICINSEALGFWDTLDCLVERIGEMLQYKNYHAINVIPYPEDAVVAKWVLEYAEPNGIIDKSKGMWLDDRPFLKPTEEWLSSRKASSPKVKILGRRNTTT